jgi:hypothetical protein
MTTQQFIHQNLFPLLLRKKNMLNNNVNSTEELLLELKLIELDVLKTEKMLSSDLDKLLSQLNKKNPQLKLGLEIYQLDI